MKKIILYLTMLAVLPLAFMGCSTISGDNPMGTTGGGEGYGVIDPANSYGLGGGSDLYGIWRHDYDPGEYELIYLYENGTINVFDYYNWQLEDSFYGTFTFSSTTLFITLQGQSTHDYPYELDNDYLTIYFGGNPTVYYRY
jgi:hypothetical protein